MIKQDNIQEINQMKTISNITRKDLRSRVLNKYANPDFGAIEILEYALMPRVKKSGQSFFITAYEISKDIKAYCYITVKEKMMKLYKSGIIEVCVYPIKKDVEDVVTNYKLK